MAHSCRRNPTVVRELQPQTQNNHKPTLNAKTQNSSPPPPPPPKKKKTVNILNPQNPSLNSEP